MFHCERPIYADFLEEVLLRELFLRHFTRFVFFCRAMTGDDEKKIILAGWHIRERADFALSGVKSPHAEHFAVTRYYIDRSFLQILCSPYNMLVDFDVDAC